MNMLAIIEQQVTKLRFADAHGVCQHGFEYGLQLAGRR
jgi:hypothetical protein